jgi:hypothetical protein
MLLRLAALVIVLCATFEAATGRGARHRQKVRSEEETKNYLDYIAKLERLWWAAHENDIPAAKKALEEGAEVDDFYVRALALSGSLSLSLLFIPVVLLSFLFLTDSFHFVFTFPLPSIL